MLEEADEEPALHVAGVNGDRQADAGVVDENGVAAGLMVDAVACTGKLADEVLGADAPEAARGHAGTRTLMFSTTSSTSRGTGSLCFLRLAQ